MTSDDLFEQDGVWYKRVSVEEAQRIQYDIQLYFYYPHMGGLLVEGSTFTPENRRYESAGWSAYYWKGYGNRNFCVRVDAPKPEYEPYDK